MCLCIYKRIVPDGVYVHGRILDNYGDTVLVENDGGVFRTKNHEVFSKEYFGSEIEEELRKKIRTEELKKIYNKKQRIGSVSKWDSVNNGSGYCHRCGFKSNITSYCGECGRKMLGEKEYEKFINK